MKLPGWPPRDLRAFAALIASIGGAFAFTGFAGAVVSILSWGRWPVATAPMRIDFLGKSLLLSLAGALMVMISLGLAINRRSAKFGKDGFEMSGGDDAAATVTTTTTTAVSPASSETPA